MIRSFTLVAVVALTASLVAPAAPATATVADRVNTVVLNVASNDAGTPTSQLTLTFDTPTTAKSVEAELEETFGPLTTTRVDEDTLGAAVRIAHTSLSDRTGPHAVALRTPGYSPIYCDSSHSFSDFNGRFALQRRCGSKLVPWGYRFSTAIQAICVTNTVDESGLRWWKNGVRQSDNSPHDNLGCGYQFHGTLNPVLRGTLVRYEDDYKFRHNVNGGGNATINIQGKLEFFGSL